MNEKVEKTGWLSLSAAAEILGVHPATLRRWSDRGDVPTMITPGGHRRFATVDIEAIAATKGNLARTNQLATVWAQQALTTTRQQIANRGEAPWLNTFNNGERASNRQLGQQLLGLTMQFISASEEESAQLLEQARELGQAYGHMSVSAGLPVTAALEATLFFRDLLLETALQLPENMGVTQEANLRLMRKINTLLNTIQLQIAEVYDAGRPDILHRG